LLECGQLLNGHPEQIAELGRALRDAGGIAVRMEASGGASEWEPWLVQLESGLPKRVYASGVVLVEDDDHVVFTCGMHHFDLPDAQIALPDSAEAIAWLDAFCSYQLEEDPVLQSGHTFRPDAQSESRVFERWPDHRHHPNDGRNNPFGLWRFREPGEKGVDPCNPLPVIIPTLVAQLMATERSKSTALTRREVDAFVAERPSIAMNPRDAASLERTRGYADIEPELAWEQWQIVRATL
jgi:hypothetical protein